MDPTQALAEALSAISAMGMATTTCEREKPRGEAVESLRSLSRWLEAGGFAPDIADALARAGISA